MSMAYRITVAIVLALVAAATLFGTDFFRKNPFGPSLETQLMARINEAASQGGLVATFGEPYTKGWQLPKGHRLERFSLNDGEAVFSRLTSSVPRTNDLPTWPDRGLSFSFPIDFATRTKGQWLEIGIVARRSPQNSSETLNVVYSTQQAGNSGWQNLALGENFELKTFPYQVPDVPEGYSHQPIIVLHSDTEGRGRSVEILGVYVKFLPRGQ